MNNLDGFLAKFQKALGAMGASKEVIIEEIFTLLGVRIPKEIIEVRKNIVYISGSASLKSQIFMKKKQILEALQKQEELKKITDIK